MDIQRVAPGHAVGPARPGQASRLTTAPRRSMRTRASRPSTGGSDTQRARCRSTPSSSSVGGSLLIDAARWESVSMRARGLGLFSRGPDPVLEEIGDLRGRRALVDHQQPSAALVLQALPQLPFMGPAHDGHVHGGDGRKQTFPSCFVNVKAACARTSRTPCAPEHHVVRAVPAGEGSVRRHGRQEAVPRTPSQRVALLGLHGPRPRQDRGPRTRSQSPAGYALADQGQTGREAFIIVDGSATVRRNGKKVAVLGPGAVVGELSLLDHGPRTATVTTDTEATVLVLDQRHFSAVIDEVPTIGHKIMGVLAGRIRDLDRQIYG